MSPDGACEFDASSGPSCSHQAAFNPSVMPEDRGDPAACSQLDVMKPSSGSVTDFLSIAQHVSGAGALLEMSPTLWTSKWQSRHEASQSRQKAARRAKSMMRTARGKLANKPKRFGHLSRLGLLATSGSMPPSSNSSLSDLLAKGKNFVEETVEGVQDALLPAAEAEAKKWFDTQVRGHFFIGVTM